jgi:hypothetical protein
LESSSAALIKLGRREGGSDGHPSALCPRPYAHNNFKSALRNKSREDPRNEPGRAMLKVLRSRSKWHSSLATHFGRPKSRYLAAIPPTPDPLQSWIQGTRDPSWQGSARLAVTSSAGKRAGVTTASIHLRRMRPRAPA